MTYTILFTDNSNKTAAVIVVFYEKGDTSPTIIRHAYQKRVEYQRAYLLEDADFDRNAFWIRNENEHNEEVNSALAVLQEMLEGVKAKGGPAFERPRGLEEYHGQNRTHS